MSHIDDSDYHFNKRPDTTYFSKRIPNAGNPIRIGNVVFDVEEGFAYGREHNELVLRAVPSGRHEIVAKFYEDDRQVFALTIQKFNRKGGPSEKDYFTFRGPEIDRLIEFLLNIKQLHFPDSAKYKIRDEELRRLVLSDSQARRLFEENQDLIASIATSEFTKSDLVALGYRREQLKHFEKLLTDPAFFDAEASNKTPEGVWQRFFEANKWIFGYGLTFVFLGSLDNRKFEQTVRGASIVGGGKKVDALLKTQALVSALCFVEIKTHRTALTAASSYRSDVWRPSVELAGGVSQTQVAVSAALESINSSLDVTDNDGNPTGETLFNFEPRSFVIVGSLDEFRTEHGVNVAKYRSFELFRRNIIRPEVITFDELFQRARFIVEHHD